MAAMNRRNSDSEIPVALQKALSRLGTLHAESSDWNFASLAASSQNNTERPSKSKSTRRVAESCAVLGLAHPTRFVGFGQLALTKDPMTDYNSPFACMWSSVDLVTKRKDLAQSFRSVEDVGAHRSEFRRFRRSIRSDA